MSKSSSTPMLNTSKSEYLRPAKYDPFNYPIQNRKDTLYLNTIESSSNSRRRFLQKEDFINRVDDIMGATRRSKSPLSKPDLYSPKDINTTDKRIYNISSTPDLTGIKKKKFETGRCVNPLQPNYPLPQSKVEEPYVPRFVQKGEMITIVDPQLKLEPRQSLQVDDIKGARATPRRNYTHLESTKYSPVKPNKYLKEYNSLEPRYTIRDDENNVVNDYGYIFKSKPNPVIQKGFGTNNSLRTEDLPGAQTSGYKTFKNLNYSQPKTFFSLYKEDIDGTSPGSKSTTKLRSKTTDINNNYYSSSSMYGNFYQYGGQKVQDKYELADLRKINQRKAEEKNQMDISYKEFVNKTRANKVLNDGYEKLHGIYN